jgi:hypothetical protein
MLYAIKLNKPFEVLYRIPSLMRMLLNLFNNMADSMLLYHIIAPLSRQMRTEASPYDFASSLRGSGALPSPSPIPHGAHGAHSSGGSAAAKR